MITTTEAAGVLGITPRTIQRHIKEGHLKAKRYGRDYLIEDQELERFQRERRRRGRPEKVIVSESSHRVI